MAARGLPGHNSPTTGEPFAIMLDSGPRWTGKVELIPHMLDIPFKRRKPTTYFVNSMSDLFHESLRDEVIDRVFAVMAVCQQHTFQVLTKRAERMQRYFHQTPLPQFGADVVALDGAHERVFGRMVQILPNVDPHMLNRVAELLEDRYPGEVGFMRRWPLPNVWIGVSVGTRATLSRIDHLRETPAAVRFISLEPLLEDLGTLDLRGIHWVIVGGESGPGARPMHPDWPRAIRDQCVSAGVPFFFKQWGEWGPSEGKAFYKGPVPEFRPANDAGLARVGKKAAGRLLDGREWNDMPEVKP
jgi:protein gp37